MSADSTTDNTLYLTVTNTSVKYSLTANKQWQHDTFADRPASVRFKLQRKTGTNGVWEDYGNVQKLEVQSWGTKGYTWNGLAPYANDAERTPYYYRVVEVNPPSKYQVSYTSNKDENYSFEDGTNIPNSTITVINDAALVYTKTAIDQNGKPYTYIRNDELTPVSIKLTSEAEPIDVYIFKYKVTVTGDGILEDTLPAGFQLLRDPYMYNASSGSYEKNSSYNPRYKYINNQNQEGESDLYYVETQSSMSTDYRCYYDAASGKFYMGAQIDYRTPEYFTYHIYIPAEDLDALTVRDYVLSNTVKSIETGSEEVTATITITNEDNYITKDYRKPTDNADADVIDFATTYTLHVNPEKRTLSNTGELMIIDKLRITSYNGTALTDDQSVLDALLDSISIIDAETHQKLSTSEYSYEISYNPYTDTDVELADQMNFYPNYNKSEWTLSLKDGSNIPAGTKLVFQFVGEPRKKITGELKSPTGTLSNLADESIFFNNAGRASYVYTTTAENKQYTLSLKIYDYVKADKIVLKSVVDENGQDITSTINSSFNSGSITISNYGESQIPANSTITYEFEGEPGLKIGGTYTTGQGETENLEDLNLYFDNDGKITLQYTTNEKRNSYTIITKDNDVIYEETDTSIYSAIYTDRSYEADAVLTIYVPDERSLDITYRYKYRTNENTPNSNSIGIRPPVDTQVMIGNTAEILAKNRSETATQDNIQIVVQEAGAQNESGNYPKIRKTNAANPDINPTGAKFVIAKYDGTNWIYASDWNSSTYTLTFEGDLTETDDLIPQGAKVVEGIAAATQMKLESNILYKFVEIQSPDGYQQSAGASATLTELAGFTTYVASNPTKTLVKPETVKLNTIKQITGGGTVDISNAQLITLTAVKLWDGERNLQNTDTSVTVQLWWSYQKSDSIPKTAVLATANELGITDANFSNEKQITCINGTVTNAVWGNIPNGHNGEKIYYYLKETAYTIGETLYTLQPDGETYRDANGNPGAYKPIFDGTAANRTGTITVDNSRGLMIQKVWKNTDNSTMTAPPADKIGFKLYGLDGLIRSEEPLYSGVLSASNQWSLILPSGTDLKGYTAFAVDEDLDNTSVAFTEAQKKLLKETFNFSYTAALNGTSGKITLTNKDKTPAVINVKATKTWVDQLSAHDPVTVKLYQSETEWPDSSTPPAEATVYSADGVSGTQQIEAGGSYTWSGLPYRNPNGGHYYYYVVENAMTGDFAEYQTSYTYTDTASERKVDIENSSPDGIIIKKNWNNADQVTLPNTVTVKLYRRAVSGENYQHIDKLPDDFNESDYQFVQDVTLSKPGWQASFRDLEADDGNDNNYVYFVKEPENAAYTISYQNNGLMTSDGQTVTVTNTLKNINLKISKLWSDGNENHTDGSVTVKIHRETAGDSAAAQNNPLTLSVTPTEISVPIGSDGISVTANQSVKVRSGYASCILAPSLTNNDMTVKIIPSSTASAGDTTDVVLETLDGKQSAVIHVTLLNSPTLSLTLSKSTIKADQTVTVDSVTFTPPGGTPQDVKSSVSYESLNPDVLTIDANGNMTVTGLGTATIRAKYYYNGKEVYDTKNVTVTLSDDFTVQDVTVNKDGTAQISISPPGGTFIFTSDDPTIATVSDSGVVTGAAVGNTTITVVRNGDTNNSKTVNVTVNGGLISGTIANKQGGNDLSYTYDVSNHTITIEAFFDHNGSVEPDFSNSSLLKNLIPIKYEALNHVEGGQWQWHMSDFGGYSIESYIENTSNTKSFSEMTGDNYWYVGHGGTDKVVITVKSSSGENSGGTSGESGETNGTTISVNQTLNNHYDLGTVKAGTKFVINVKADSTAAGYLCQMAVGGTPIDGSNNWIGYNSDMHLDSNGECQFEITVPKELQSAQIQCWNYKNSDDWDTSENNVEKSTLTLVSYTVTVPASATVQSIITKGTMSALKLFTRTSAKNYTDSLLGAAVINGAEADFDSNNIMEVTVSASAENNQSGIEWLEIAKNLPVYGYENGQWKTYFYWAEEVTTGSFTASYTFDDNASETKYSIKASDAGDALITIKNTVSETGSMELPESGGPGTKLYCWAGGLLLLLSAAGYLTIKHRRWYIEQTLDGT